MTNGISISMSSDDNNGNKIVLASSNAWIYAEQALASANNALSYLNSAKSYAEQADTSKKECQRIESDVNKLETKIESANNTFKDLQEELEIFADNAAGMINKINNICLGEDFNEEEYDGTSILEKLEAIIPDLEDYALVDDVYTNFYYKEQADDRFQPKGNYLTEHQSLENYCTIEQLNKSLENVVVDAYTKAESDNRFQPKGNYLTEHQPLNDYYKKSEIDSKIGDIETLLDEIINNGSQSDNSSGSDHDTGTDRGGDRDNGDDFDDGWDRGSSWEDDNVFG